MRDCLLGNPPSSYDCRLRWHDDQIANRPPIIPKFDSVMDAPRSSSGGIERAIASARRRSRPARKSDTLRSATLRNTGAMRPLRTLTAGRLSEFNGADPPQTGRTRRRLAGPDRRALAQCLGRRAGSSEILYCRQIFAPTGDERFPYCLVGSGAAVRIENRHFVFCCVHQVRDYTPDKIAIPLSFDTRIMSAATAPALKVNNENRDGDTIEVAAFEFDLARYDVANLNNEFFPIDDARIWPTGTAQTPFMASGYPSHRQLFDEDRIGARCISVQAVFDGGTSSPHLQRVRTEKAIDADGMSGGPVFYIGGAPGDYFVGFAGMVMRGGRDHLHFMSAGFLIDLALGSETEQWSAWLAQI
jgi:hypothetical protein